MDPQRWQQIEELFRTVINRPAEEREAHLTRVCAGDEELRREVLSLLARDTADDFLSPPIANIALALSAESLDDLTGAAHRSVSADPIDRSRRDGRGVRSRARRSTIRSVCRAQADQARDGFRLRPRSFPARAANSGFARSPAHRAAV
jgi:hypothetical protein